MENKWSGTRRKVYFVGGPHKLLLLLGSIKCVPSAITTCPSSEVCPGSAGPTPSGSGFHSFGCSLL